MAKRASVFVLIASLIALAACGGGSSSSGTTGSSDRSTSVLSARNAVSTWRSAYGAIVVKGKGYAL